MPFISDLQNKPKKTRVFYVWLFASIICIIITVIWLVFFARNEFKMNGDEKSEILQVFQGLSEIKGEYDKSKDSIIEQVDKIKEAVQTKPSIEIDKTKGTEIKNHLKVKFEKIEFESEKAIANVRLENFSEDKISISKFELETSESTIFSDKTVEISPKEGKFEQIEFKISNNEAIRNFRIKEAKSEGSEDVWDYDFKISDDVQQ